MHLHEQISILNIVLFFHFPGIQDYILNQVACDDQPNANYRSLIEGQNYLRSGWVGRIVHQVPSAEAIVMKGQVRHSQSINNYHAVEVTFQREHAKVIGSKCDCMANRGRCCSHVAGFLYKINQAVIKGLTGIACTDTTCAWNNSTSQNVLPDTVENIRAADDTTSKSTFVMTTCLETDDDVIKHFTSGAMAGLASIPGTIMNHVIMAKPVEIPSSDHDVAFFLPQHSALLHFFCAS